MSWNTDVFDEMYGALADMPRSGRPTKIPRKLLAKAEAWCLNSAFTTMELCNYMKEISGVRSSRSQTRRYTVRWGYSRKKTSPMHMNKAAIQDVEGWQESITRMVAQYTKLGYTIATQNESNYTGCHTDGKILGKGRIAHIHAVVRGPSEVLYVLYIDCNCSRHIGTILLLWEANTAMCYQYHVILPCFNTTIRHHTLHQNDVNSHSSRTITCQFTHQPRYRMSI